MQTTNKKWVLICSGALTAIFILVFLLYKPVIFQEGNPWPLIKGIAELNLGNTGIVKLSGSGDRYMTKSSRDQEGIKKLMKDKGYTFTEQLGSGYFFESPSGEGAVVTHKYYSRYYSLWSITTNSNVFKNDTRAWITTTTDAGTAFQFPKELAAQYVSEAEWPPIIRIGAGTYACEITPMEISSASEITSQRQIDGRTYCVNVKNEGAAGSVYSSYAYTTVMGDKLINVSFVLRFNNCANYDEEQNLACTRERETFDIDAAVDKIVQTIRWEVTRNESPSAKDELPEQITNFDSCVAAGFSIMKSNPPQCATPDGRTFVQEN